MPVDRMTRLLNDAFAFSDRLKAEADADLETFKLAGEKNLNLNNIDLDSFSVEEMREVAKASANALGKSKLGAEFLKLVIKMDGIENATIDEILR